MSTVPCSDAGIIQAWRDNALPWIAAVREGRIESRRQVTDRAIIEAVLSRSPRSVLDIGCGEGWLVRELTARHIAGVGVDAVPGLVEAARHAGGGDFLTMSYEEIAAGKLGMSADAVVCNFSLLGDEAVEGLFRTGRSLLHAQGRFIVQTLHPLVACGDHPYRDGWRDGSWAGLSGDFCAPAPWYFRTLESWTRLYVDCGFRLCEIREPLHPETRQPASVILIGEVAG